MRIWLLGYYKGEMTTRPHHSLAIARVGSCYGLRISFVWRRPGAHPRPSSLSKVWTPPPTQLAAPVVPGDSGQHEEEAPLVADDAAAVEEAMHDAMDEDDDVLRYLNTGADGYDDGGLMA